MITLAICWKAVWSTLIFIAIMAGICGWFFLGIWLTTRNTKASKIMGWIVLGLFALAILYLIYYSYAIKLCGA